MADFIIRLLVLWFVYVCFFFDLFLKFILCLTYESLVKRSITVLGKVLYLPDTKKYLQYRQ